jgi:hypothetical protein
MGEYPAVVFETHVLAPKVGQQRERAEGSAPKLFRNLGIQVLIAYAAKAE